MTHPDKDNQAELIAAANAVVERWHSRDWKAPHTKEFIERLAAAVGAAKAAPPALDTEGLPDLPQPMRKVYERPHGVQELLYYTAEQVRQAQREAIAADRLGRHGQQPARASVADDPKFLSLLADIYSAGICYSSAEVDRAALIAHINAWGGVTEDHTKQEK